MVTSEEEESEGRDPEGRDAVSVPCDTLDISAEGAVGSAAVSPKPVAGLAGGDAKSHGRGTIAAGIILIIVSAVSATMYSYYQERHTM
jgi:hypothetical protein